MPERIVALSVGGMTCASCAARVEKKLNRLEGVTATVNFATERAQVSFPDSLSVEDLVAVVEKTGYTATPPAARTPPDAEAEGQQRPAGADEANALLQRLLICLFLAVPVVGIAMTMQFPGGGWISLMLAAPVATWGAWPFHRAALLNARHGAATMDTLISVGVLASFAWSVYALVAGGDIYLDSAASVTALILLGRYLETRARRLSGAAVRALAELGVKDVAVLRGGEEVRVPVWQLAAGDLFVVRPGEKIATDGVVESGSSAVDTSMLTGEPVPADITAGDAVTGGCVSMSGRLVVRATRVGADTQLAQITRLVEEAQTGKAAVQRLADRVSGVFVPAVIVIALVALSAWLASGHPAGASVAAAVAVLIIACPCAMGLATPTALLAGTGRGAQFGILIRGPEVLESTRSVDTVVLDKTGTVTTGKMSLADVFAAPGEDGGEVLRLAGAVEAASEHPIAAAIASAAVASVALARDTSAVPSSEGGTAPARQSRADERPLQPVAGDYAGRSSTSSTSSALTLARPVPDISDFSAHVGFGVSGVAEDHAILVGRRHWLSAEWSLTIPSELADRANAAEASGQTAVFAAWDGQVRGVLVVSDTVKPAAAEAISRLRGMGLRPVLLTGDNERAARTVAAAVGIDEVIAGVLPAGKAEAIRSLQASGRVVAMAGDGVNDAAALAQADLGLAMGTGADAAIEASDLTLVGGDLRAVPDAILLARRTLGTIKGNLFWAFAYNVAAIPLAALGLLNPMIAAAAMAFSSVFVVTNSLRLRSFRPAR